MLTELLVVGLFCLIGAISLWKQQRATWGTAFGWAMLLYCLFLSSEYLVERQRMWGQWERTWSQEYAQRLGHLESFAHDVRTQLQETLGDFQAQSGVLKEKLSAELNAVAIHHQNLLDDLSILDGILQTVEWSDARHRLELENRLRWVEHHMVVQPSTQ